MMTRKEVVLCWLVDRAPSFIKRLWFAWAWKHSGRLFGLTVWTNKGFTQAELDEALAFEKSLGLH